MPGKKQEIQRFRAGLEANFAMANAEKYQIAEVDKRDRGALKSSLSQKLFANTFDTILKDRSIWEKLEKLEPGGNIEIKRPRNSDKIRSFNIVMDDDGTIYLFIEPKSKRFDNTKRLIKWVGGSYKTRKICVRADTPTAEPYVSMIEYINPDKQDALEIAKGEIAAAKLFKGLPGFPHCIFGGQRVKVKNILGVSKPMQRMVTYSRYKPSSLFELLRTDWLPHGVEFRTKEQEALKYDIIRQLINIVEIIHSKRIEHNDLKPSNFLVDYDYEQARYVLNSIDYGLQQRFGTEMKVLGTSIFVPPWLMRYGFAGYTIAALKSSLGFKENYRQTLGWSMLKRVYPDQIPPKTTIPMANGEHDMWSLGIMCYQIIYGLNHTGEQMRINIMQDPLLQSLFKLDLNVTENDIDPTRFAKIQEFKAAFESNKDVQDILADLPDPNRHPHDPSIELLDLEKETNPPVEEIRDTVESIDDYCARIDRLFAPHVGVDVRDIKVKFVHIAPMGLQAVFFNNRDDFAEHMEATDMPNFYTDAYPLVRELYENAFANQSLGELKRSFLIAKRILHKVDIHYKNFERLGETWAEYARWQLAMRTIMCLTSMHIVKLEAEKTASITPRWQFGKMVRETAFGKPEKKYILEVAQNKAEINKLFPNLQNELMVANFERIFGEKPGQ